MLRLVLVFLVPLLLALAVSRAAAAPGDRVALLIGNGDYAHVPDLANPPRDVAALGATLERLGFAVTRVENAGFEGLRRALRDFEDTAAGAAVALVYYAGHGIEVEGQNFMIPVDARLGDSRDIEYETVPLALLQRAADPARQMSLVILDACRNNPFLAQMQGSSRSISRGLALVEPKGQNRLVAYAAKEGTVADDGDAGNSPYAAALVAALEEPGLEIGKLFRRVRDRVYDATGGRQEPALYGSLSEQDFFFVPPTGAQDAAGAPGAPAPDIDALFWASIEASEEPDDFRDYLKQFPNGMFADVARRRLARLIETVASRSRAADATAALPAAGVPDPVAGAGVGLRPGAGQGPAGGGTATLAATGPAGAMPAAVFSATPAIVAAVQAALDRLGFDPGPVDGVVGPRTRGAIRAYQARMGLAPDGAVTADLIDRLTGRPRPIDPAEFGGDRPAARVAAVGDAASDAGAATPDWPLGRWCEAAADNPFAQRCAVVYDEGAGAVTISFFRGGDPVARACLYREGPRAFRAEPAAAAGCRPGPGSVSGGDGGMAVVWSETALTIDGTDFRR